VDVFNGVHNAIEKDGRKKCRMKIVKRGKYLLQIDGCFYLIAKSNL